jgi:hypothetical protein
MVFQWKRNRGPPRRSQSFCEWTIYGYETLGKPWPWVYVSLSKNGEGLFSWQTVSVLCGLHTKYHQSLV